MIRFINTNHRLQNENYQLHHKGTGLIINKIKCYKINPFNFNINAE